MLPIDRNPRFNTRINPQFNTRLNPRFNTNINPRFNVRINPRFNSAINPRFNMRINPMFSNNLNYHHNRQLNPVFNAAINPYRNSSINPNVVVAFKQPAIFNMAHQWIGFAVKFPCPNVDGYIVFNMNLNVEMRCFSNLQDGYNLFDNNNQWIGIWIKTESGFLEYVLNSNETRYVIL